MQQEGEIVLQGRLCTVPPHTICRPADSSLGEGKVPKYSRGDECSGSGGERERQYGQTGHSPGLLQVPATRPTTLLSWGRKVTVLMRRRQSSGRGIWGDGSDGMYLKAKKHCSRGRVGLIFY